MAMKKDTGWDVQECPNCHDFASAEWNYCPWCGVKLENTIPVRELPKDK